MNHYPHHIGDFNSATRHLTFVERALYRELLDLYYDTERALIADATKLARRILANTEELREAMHTVLEEFFELREDGWHNARCDREIEAYRQRLEQQSRAGRASAAKRSGSGGGQDGSNGRSTGGAAVPALGESAGLTTVERPLNARSTNQNQNQNHIKPPNPPAGGAGGVTAFAPPLNPGPADQAPSTATPPARPAAPRGSAAPGAGTATGTATALCGYFPEHRRTRLAEVGTMVASLEADGTVTGEQLLKAAAQQAGHLSRDNGKACPSVLRWLREQRWLDGAASVSHAGAVPADWRNSRSGIEAMGVRLGLGPWDQGVHRLLSQYEAAVEAALAATRTTAEA